MSLLPYWLGLRPMTYTSYIKIRGGGPRKSPTPSTYLDESSEGEGSVSTMEVYCQEELGGTDDRPGASYEALEDLDAPPEDLFEGPNPHIVRRDLRIQEARQNRKHMEALRDEAVLKARKDMDKTMATGSQAFPQRTSTVKKRGNKGRKKQRPQETRDPVLSRRPGDHTLPRGALDEQQQHARQNRSLHASPAPSASFSVGGRRQPHQHDGHRLMTHARDRGHHRSFATTATTTPFPPDPSSPDSKATARDHNVSSPPTMRAPRSLASPSMPLAGGIHGIRRIDPSTSAFPTSPPQSPRPHVPRQGPSSPPRIPRTETIEIEQCDDRGRRSQAPSPTPLHQQLQEQRHLQQQQKEMRVEHASEETEASVDTDLPDIGREGHLLRRIVMGWLGNDSSQYWEWLRDEERRMNQDEMGP